MSAEPKLRGGSDSELTRLKTLWRGLSDDAREYWRSQFASGDITQADIRKQIFAKLKINLKWDKQLTNFRAWLDNQDMRDEQAERMQENERRLKEEHPDWSLDQVREEVLRQSYFETLATGNFQNLGLKAVTTELKANAQKADQQRYLDAKRSDEEKALSLCLEDAKAYPEVQELFKAAFTALKKAKGGKG